MVKSTTLVLTCEHASSKIPKQWMQLFKGHEDILETHRGYDIGSLAMANRLSRLLNVPLYAGKWSRLLIDLNRSETHRDLFSEFTRRLGPADRERIIRDCYRPHREEIERVIKKQVDRGAQVIHIGVHSFTPVLKNEMRKADIGLLYDPSRSNEKTFCINWQQSMMKAEPGLKVRRNYPYLGIADGFVTYLRKRFDNASYLGIELEVSQTVNQDLATNGVSTLKTVLEEWT